MRLRLRDGRLIGLGRGGLIGLCRGSVGGGSRRLELRRRLARDIICVDV